MYGQITSTWSCGNPKIAAISAASLTDELTLAPERQAIAHPGTRLWRALIGL